MSLTEVEERLCLVAEKNLSYQYKLLLKYSEKYRPELYLKIVGADDDLTEFHHTLWGLPFYKMSYEVGTTGFFNKTTTYIRLIDNQLGYSVEMYRFSVVKYTKNIFTKNETIVSEYVTCIDDDFEKYVELIFKDLKPVSFETLPDKLWLKLM